MHKFFCLYIIMISILSSSSLSAQLSITEDQAIQVLQRTIGDKAQDVKITYDSEKEQCAKLVIKDNKIHITSSDSITAIYGIYAYLKSQGNCMVSWSGKRLDLPLVFADTVFEVSTPFKYRYYFNVVTYGYTLPYWDWQRWEQEIDWMALHGINMPLALVATEAISQRVWRRLGLTQEQIDVFFTGPAHLPWQRMGNITKHDGPLSQQWHQDQIKLQHKILKRMRVLGMHPVAPGFAGFVPADLKMKYPDIKLHALRWGGFPKDKQAFILSPMDPLFQEIGKMFIQEWEKEFGKCEFYIADSFNEMELPEPKSEHRKLLSECGNAIYQSIKAGNPDATWVVQGWMFGYQRYIWSPEYVEALFSKVPDDKVFILSEACDYNALFWRNGMDYELYNGFNGKQWGMGYIPNMGGKNGWTGVFDYYAGAVEDALKSPKKGNLLGYGLCPEGIENNEVLYELLTEAAWQKSKICVPTWISKHANARYGAYPQHVKEAWQCLLASCYGSFTDHPRIGWQYMGFGGSLNRSDSFMRGVELFLSNVDSFKDEKLYTNDALDLASMYLGIKADQWFAIAKKAHDFAQLDVRDSALENANMLMIQADLLLESHPTMRLSRWIDFAKQQGTTTAEKEKYERNARRLVTVWGPPVNDYSARMWSGLIRDFYLPRMNAYFDALKSNRHFERSKWEEAWVASLGVSPIKTLENPLHYANKYVMQASKMKIPKVIEQRGVLIGEWFPSQLSGKEIELEFNVTMQQLKESKSIQFLFINGAHRLDILSVSIELDGVEVWKDERLGTAGTPNRGNVYHYNLPQGSMGNNSSKVRARVKSHGGNQSQGQVRLIK